MAEYDRYFAAERDLKIFSSLGRENQQVKLRNMNNYELGLFALYLSKHLEQMSIKLPNLTLASKVSTKRVLMTSSNLLESIIGGLADKYISKEIARQEIIKVAANIIQIKQHLQHKAKKMKREQIANINVKSAQFRSVDLSELDKFIDKLGFNKVTQQIAPILKEFGNDIKPNSKISNLAPIVNAPIQNEPASDGGDPYASPSRYNEYLTGFTQNYHRAFQKATSQIKIPNTVGTQPGQTLWAVTLLPLFISSFPTLKPNELQRAGIKFDELDRNSMLLYKQHVLIVYTKQTEKDYEDTVNRAKLAIKEQFNTDYLYSKGFTSKEVGKPLAFYWLIASSSRLSPFKITSIGLPFAPELQKVENLTHDVNVIRQRTENENKAQMERAERMKQLVAPIVEQYNHVKTQIDTTRQRIKQLVSQLELLNLDLTRKKQDLQRLTPGSEPYKKLQAGVIAINSQIAIVQDTIKNERNVRVMGLKQKLEQLMEDIKKFQKEHAAT